MILSNNSWTVVIIVWVCCLGVIHSIQAACINVSSIVGNVCLFVETVWIGNKLPRCWKLHDIGNI